MDTIGYEKRLHQIAADIVDEPLNGLYQERLMSVISMVHTLIAEKRLNELYKVLELNFSEYYGTVPSNLNGSNN